MLLLAAAVLGCAHAGRDLSADFTGADSGRQLLQSPSTADCDRSVNNCEACRFQFFRGTVTKVRRAPGSWGQLLRCTFMHVCARTLGGFVGAASSTSSARTIPPRLPRLPSLPGQSRLSSHPLPWPLLPPLAPLTPGHLHQVRGGLHRQEQRPRLL